MLIGAATTAALHGTRWGWGGLYADSAFRTQMATRYAETPGLFDYNYRGLPAYYPPAVGWVQGRLAALTGVPGWEAVKPVQLLVGVLVPLAAYLLWRPVVGALPAAAVAVLVTIWTAEPHKPDEWLVLACLLPWWLLAVRDVRAPGVARWPAWRLGVVLGLLLLVHTYWFLPFGVATVLALGYDAVRRRLPRRSGPRPAPRLPLRRAAAIGAVGLVVAAPTWVPIVVARLRLPSDSLQLRYSFPGGHDLALPSARGGGAAGLVGLAWLAWAAWCRLRGRDLGGTHLALAGGLGLASSALRHAGPRRPGRAGRHRLPGLQDAGRPAHGPARRRRRRCRRLAGPLAPARRADGARRLGPPARRRRPRRAARRRRRPTTSPSSWVVGHPRSTAQTTRYPDGSMPAGDPDGAALHPHAVRRPTDEPVAEVRAAWASLRPDVPLADAVLVTSQVDLLATTPVHGFLTYKSIYSHPNGRFERAGGAARGGRRLPDACVRGRPAARQRVRRRRRPGAAAGGRGLLLPLMVDDFPDRTVGGDVGFPDRVLTGPEFERVELGRIVVIALRD